MFICPLLHPKKKLFHSLFYAFSVSLPIGNLSLRRHPVHANITCDLRIFRHEKYGIFHSIQKSLFTPRLGKTFFSICATAGMSSAVICRILICENPLPFPGVLFPPATGADNPACAAASSAFPCWYKMPPSTATHAARCLLQCAGANRYGTCKFSFR